MKRFPLFMPTCLAVALAASPTAQSDSAEVWCIYSVSSCPYLPMSQSNQVNAGTCGFSQFGGNIYIDFDGQDYSYINAEQGETYERINRSDGIRLHRKDTLMTILWEKPSPDLEGC